MEYTGYWVIYSYCTTHHNISPGTGSKFLSQEDNNLNRLLRYKCNLLLTEDDTALLNSIKDRTRVLSSQHQPTEIETIMQQTENYSGAHNFQGVLLVMVRREEGGGRVRG